MSNVLCIVLFGREKNSTIFNWTNPIYTMTCVRDKKQHVCLWHSAIKRDRRLYGHIIIIICLVVLAIICFIII